MRPIGVYAVAIAIAGCDDAPDIDRSASSAPALTIRAEGITPTAVGESLLFGVRVVDSATNAWLTQDIDVSAICEGLACNVTRTTSSFRVTSRVADTVVVKVTATNALGEAYTQAFPIPFRAATKIVATRAIAHSPAGTAFAMVPGDAQTWSLRLADDLGPLRFSTDALAVTLEGGDVTCHTSHDEVGPHDNTFRPRLDCRLRAEGPGSMRFHARYGALEREETLTIIPLLAVRKAELLRCDSRRDEVAIEDEHLPCVTVEDLTSETCDLSGRSALTARLELEDGTVAVGGGALLSIADTQWKAEMLMLPTGKGTILGRFGTELISVPYDLPEYCP